MTKRLEIPDYLESALQGIALWVNYKAQYYYGHLLSEGALVGELTQLLAPAIPHRLKLRCEVMYKVCGVKSLGQKRMDLAIGEPSSTPDADLSCENLVAIEVKRFNRGSWVKVEEDFKKLLELKKAVPSCRAFQILIGQTDRPGRLLNKNHEMIRKAIFQQDDFKAVPRMSKKSFHTKRNSERGAYSVILEILSP